jgi:DNA topoisomerase-2
LEFTVETIDAERGKKFKQTFKNNMGDRDNPSITSSKLKGYTKITFKPDLERFSMLNLSDDIVALMTKRVYDVAGCNPTLKVYLNGEKLPIRSFKQYCELYLKDPLKPKLFEKGGERWDVCLSISDGEFQQVSFVNSICTMTGGTHVKHVVDKISKDLLEAVNKKNKGAPVKPAQIKNHIWIFVNCLIENPGFDSQTKEKLTTPPARFGSTCVLGEEFLKKGNFFMFIAFINNIV